MPTETDAGNRIRTAEAAFDTIGEATRIGILQALGEEEPQPFAQLRKRVGVDDSGLFNYHLGELTGHFVQKTDEGYALREPGSRIVQAVLSGAVVNPAVMDPTELEAPCPYCGESITIMFKAERLVISCDHCPGSFDGTETDARFLEEHPSGTVAVLKFPPAGLAGRSPHEVLDAALGWTLEQIQALANGHCPRCAAVTERSVSV